MELAKKFAAGPTFAMGMTKVQVYNEWTMALPAAIEAEAQAQNHLHAHRRFCGRLPRLQGKTPPNFEGL
jgi:enoyl-CoA hydratase/carnithine racemase